jgi:hypothetical protein
VLSDWGFSPQALGLGAKGDETRRWSAKAYSRKAYSRKVGDFLDRNMRRQQLPVGPGMLLTGALVPVQRREGLFALKRFAFGPIAGPGLRY